MSEWGDDTLKNIGSIWHIFCRFLTCPLVYASYVQRRWSATFDSKKGCERSVAGHDCPCAMEHCRVSTDYRWIP